MEKQEVKVSVIIPVYNQESYVSVCLDSIVKQTLREIEIICIDDGSTDGSAAVLRTYAEKDDRIRVVSRENRGVGFSRNEGLLMATGEFVSFVDPDDYLPGDEVLRLLYEAVVRDGTKIAGGSLIVYDDEKGVETAKRFWPDKFSGRQVIHYSSFQFDYGFQRYIYERKMLLENGIAFPEYKRFQDPPFFIRAMTCADTFSTIPEGVYVYRWVRKFSKWDDERTFHLVSALRDDLVFAKEHQFWNLYDQTLMRVKKDFRDVLNEYRTEDVLRVRNEILMLSICVSREKWGAASSIEIPAVSVVLPIYNAAAYLRPCLESLVSQTLREIEFICVNDGSTDDSLAIMREFQHKDPRFRIVDKTNTGYGHTMNCGISFARGKYLAIVEPDDYVKPDMFSTLVSTAEANDVEIVKSGIIHHWDGREDVYRPISTDKSILNRVLDPRKDKGLFNAVMNNVTGIYLRSFVQEHGIHFNETPGASYQDNSFYLQTHYLARRVYLLPQAFYVYRQDNAASSINSKGRAFAIFEEFRLNDEILRMRPDLSKIFLGHYIYKKFKSYKFHLGRITMDSRLEFIQRFADEFREHERRGEIDWSLMAKGHAEILRSIIDDCRKYYQHITPSLQDVCDQLVKARLDARHAAKRVQFLTREVGALKSSESYRVGMFVTWPMRRAYRMLKCYRENGFKYTLRRLVLGKGRGRM